MVRLTAFSGSSTLPVRANASFPDLQPDHLRRLQILVRRKRHPAFGRRDGRATLPGPFEGWLRAADDILAGIRDHGHLAIRRDPYDAVVDVHRHVQIPVSVGREVAPVDSLYLVR